MTNREIYDTNIRAIYHAAHTYSSRFHDREDWLQMCALRCLQYLHCYSEDKGKFSTWVHYVIKNFRDYEDNRKSNKLFKTNYDWKNHR
jgi:DNA-directed RNA polymerase specialized sigma24 family protein